MFGFGAFSELAWGEFPAAATTLPDYYYRQQMTVTA